MTIDLNLTEDNKKKPNGEKWQISNDLKCGLLMRHQGPVLSYNFEKFFPGTHETLPFFLLPIASNGKQEMRFSGFMEAYCRHFKFLSSSLSQCYGQRGTQSPGKSAFRLSFD